MGYKLFLDDERQPPDDETTWIIVRSYNEFVKCILTYGHPEFVSFDHDLGPGKDGYDCAKWLAMRCVDKSIHLPGYYIHSQNPVGANAINFYLAATQKFIDSEILK